MGTGFCESKKKRGNRRHVPRETKEHIARLSLDPRLKIKDIAQAAGVSHQTVNRTLHKWRSKGCAVREYEGFGRPSALGAAELEYLELRHKEEPTAKLHVLQQELRDKFDIEVHATTISRHRHKLGLVQVDPQKVRAQEEREEQRRAEALQKLAERKLTFADVDKENRAAFLSRVRSYNPRTLVFVDAFSFSNTYSAPLAYPDGGGRLKGEPSMGGCVASRRRTVHLALTIDGLLDFSCLPNPYPPLSPTTTSPLPSSPTRPSSSTTHRTSFLTRTLSYLQPFPAPHSVLIAPNAAPYTHPALRAEVERRGAKILHYPRYAGDLNPLGRAGARVRRWAAASASGSATVVDTSPAGMRGRGGGGRTRHDARRLTRMCACARGEEEDIGMCMDMSLGDGVGEDVCERVDEDQDAVADALFDALCQITPEVAQEWLKEIGYNVNLPSAQFQ